MRKTNRKKLILLILVSITTLIVSQLPGFHPEHFIGLKYHWSLDMLFHGGYYLFITFVILNVFYQDFNILYTILLILVISIILEFIQIYTSRSFSALDLLSNTLGISIAYIMFLILKKKKNKGVFSS